MPEPSSQPFLDDLLQRMLRLQAQPGIGKKALGVADWDRELWQMGRTWLKTHRCDSTASSFPMGGDLYLATQLYANGGHTGLIGDFVHALDAGGMHSRLILTDINARCPHPLPAEIIERVGLPAENITILAGPSLSERLDQLMERIQAQKPRRLFLFHHPEDPLAGIVCQPEFAEQRFLVHHADSSPTFGLHLPGIQIIELNPIAAAMSRLLGLDPALLPLCAEDPGPRSGGFLRKGHLVTASCGSQHKFTSSFFYTYPETVALVLRTTGGEHVHIGPLSAATLRQIHGALAEGQIPACRFIHVPWTRSVSACLWEHGCDVYLSSFPIDGARTNAEVLASATPHLRFSHRADDLWIDGALTWRTWEELIARLRELASADGLAEKSRLMRRAYEEHHHPRNFAGTLHGIIDSGRGRIDPHQPFRDQRSIHSLMKSLVTTLTTQAQTIEGLQEQNNLLKEQLDRLLANDAGRCPPPPKPRFLNWFTRD